jgi:protein-tyrosine phosphatase
LAEGIFAHMIEQEGLQNKISCDSCGTAAYHIGSQPDARTYANARANGLILSNKARRFDRSDLDEFDHILVMDRANYDEVGQFFLDEAHESKVLLMRHYDPENREADVPDPYYGGDGGFQDVYDILYRSCRELFKIVREKMD